MGTTKLSSGGILRAPEIVRDAPLLTFYLEAHPAAFRGVLPPRLSPHPECHVVLNMWFQPNSAETSGFGQAEPLGVSYLAVEIDGEESTSSDGGIRFPSRFWLEHWNSSRNARRYASEASRLHIESGETSLVLTNGWATATLKLGGRTVISSSARIGSETLGTASGHSIYFAECEDRTSLREVAQFTVPWVSDSYSASHGSVAFDFPEGSGCRRLFSNGPQVVSRVTFRRITLVPYLATHFFNACRVEKKLPNPGATSAALEE